MCGIAGWLAGREQVSQEIVERMIGRLHHRGPDAQGVLIESNIGLAHARLAVIDLDARANQPMESGDRRFVIVFNGEIYNYKELRNELEVLGHCFRTNSDTEVVAEAWAVWKEAALTRFNGMFAFAIWDRQERTLFLARDRLGKKPLYYCPTPKGGLVFASELKALREHPAVSNRVNPQAIREFLTLNYITTGNCIFEGVKKLPPAHYAIARGRGEPQPVQYWDLASSFREKREHGGEAAAEERLLELLDDAVRIRMVADVPLGAFLSGGLDSSAIVASMAKNVSSEKIHTFSIGFGEKSYNELPWAREVAETFHVVHSDEVLTDDISVAMERIVYYMDEPFADTSILPTYFLSRFARQHVTVALSGDGGDELFAGYETYLADRIHYALAGIPGGITSFLARMVDRTLPVTKNKVSLDYKIRQFIKGMTFPGQKAHYSWRTMYGVDENIPVMRQEYWECSSGDRVFDTFSEFYGQVRQCHYLDQAMYVDIKTWLVDDILVKVDRCSMAHSLETRAPLLDYRIVEFAASLPVGWKLRGFNKKYIFKRSQRNRLPARIINRKKSGFNAPLAHWFAGAFKELLMDAIHTDRAREVLVPEAVEALLVEHEKGLADHSFRLFGILCLALWLGAS